ncbi:MAG: hypothetical protein V2A73_14145 [Pseudomonadota bacterium]
MKTVYVILAFHSHEPNWDLPRKLCSAATDGRVGAAVLPESYLRKRLHEGRNVYRDLIQLSVSLRAPLSLDMTNEILYQLHENAPATLAELARAFDGGLLRPVLTCAHHTHPTLLSSQELVDEIRLNRELLEQVLRVSRSGIEGAFLPECSLEVRHLAAIEDLGVAFVFTPELLPPRIAFRVVPGDADIQFRPFRLGNRLVGLPRHFAVSQEIWRPITLRSPDRVKYQGFLVGKAPIFVEEYAGAPLAKALPESSDDAAAEYSSVLLGAIAAAPDRGLLLYLQDLELMDFGEEALAIVLAGWRRALAATDAQLRFVAPSEFVEAECPSVADLPAVTIWQVSWAPELRPALRADGHYPPRGVGVYRGHDVGRAVFGRWPFVFWEAGRFPTRLIDWLLESYGFPSTVETSASILLEERYDLVRFPPDIRLPLLARLAKRACNYGWYPDEGMNKRAFLDLHLIAEALLLETKLRQHRASAPVRIVSALPPWVWPGLAYLPELLVDPRVRYLRFGLERWREERGADPTRALVEVEHARAMRRFAREELIAAASTHRTLVDRPSAELWKELAARVAEYAKCMVLSLDHLQRAWGNADADFLINSMYRFLQDQYPPLLPRALEDLETNWGFAPTTSRLTF